MGGCDVQGVGRVRWVIGMVRPTPETLPPSILQPVPLARAGPSVCLPVSPSLEGLVTCRLSPLSLASLSLSRQPQTMGHPTLTHPPEVRSTPHPKPESRKQVSGKDIHALLLALLRPSDSLYPVRLTHSHSLARARALALSLSVTLSLSLSSLSQ